ncbi:RNA-binding transcriptional accessory protein [Clostridia bacterium]|nr:RNA-binding transcriptional accessory protein [Clostridia bacterium]
MDYAKILAREFSLLPKHAENIIALIDEGNTIPFIARYRKELHGSTDDQKLREFAERLDYLRALDKRKAEVLNSISEQGKLTPELQAAIDAALTLAAVEDLYRPYRQKRRTRATIARERGLEPLADWLSEQEPHADFELVQTFLSPENGLDSVEACLDGARDILAERFSDDAALRAKIRPLLFRNSSIKSEKAGDDPEGTYKSYYEFEEPLNRCPHHRVLAMNRGEKEGVLRVTLVSPHDAAIGAMKNALLQNNGSPASEQVALAIEAGWKRLLFPSLERELRGTLSEGAQTQAIKMFSLNLKQLLMQPPVRGRVILAVDPAYRTGCKLAVIDATGKALDTAVIYPTPPQNKVAEAVTAVKALINKHKVTVIAIGNGTASKEAEIFVANVIKETPGVSYMMVSEAGASVYSASKLAAEEFPQYDVSLRSAVSIARRLQDPLAELVKVEPKSIGVGQYQHDMPPAQLSKSLDGVVEDCVNSVGVDLNAASAALLSRVAGLGPAVAKNIVSFRDEHGVYRDRKTLLKVPKLGRRAFEQCAGFLRVPESKNVLDNTSIHPESYAAAEKLLNLFELSDTEIAAINFKLLGDWIAERGEEKVAKLCGIGVPTLRDVLAALSKPGRDPRDELPPPLLRTDILDLKDLKPGMTLTGTVRNVIDFGAFVDVGVHQDGLVHVSRLSKNYVRHPTEVVKVGDIVDVTVLEVDTAKKRISLSMV